MVKPRFYGSLACYLQQAWIESCNLAFAAPANLRNIIVQYCKKKVSSSHVGSHVAPTDTGQQCTQESQQYLLRCSCSLQTSAVYKVTVLLAFFLQERDRNKASTCGAVSLEGKKKMLGETQHSGMQTSNVLRRTTKQFSARVIQNAERRHQGQAAIFFSMVSESAACDII